MQRSAFTISNKMRCEFYAPKRFQETWRKFIKMCNRDNQSASELIRIWIDRYVQVKDPSNPQLPITAFDPTHLDYHVSNKLRVKDLFMEKAKKQSNEIYFRDLVHHFRDLPIMKSRIERAREMAQLLRKEGIGIIQ